LHGGSFQQYPIAVRPIHHALLIICQIAQQVCELAHTTRNFSTATQQHDFLKSPTSASSAEISPEKLISFES
jgi:hypothetical protein